MLCRLGINLDQLGTWTKAAHFLLDLLAHLRDCKARPESVTKGESIVRIMAIQLQEKEEAPGNLVVYLARSQLYRLSLADGRNEDKPISNGTSLHETLICAIWCKDSRYINHSDGWVKSQGFWCVWWLNHIFVPCLMLQSRWLLLCSGSSCPDAPDKASDGAEEFQMGLSENGAPSIFNRNI